MNKIMLANFKAHFSPEHMDAWLQLFQGDYLPTDNLQLILAVPFLALERCLHRVKALPQVSLCAQGVSPYPQGSYTGATPASWLEGMAAYVLVGHRERRRYFHETVQDVANQVREGLAAGLRPIICVGDHQLGAQMAALDTREIEKSLFAYTPEDAEQLDIARSKEKIRETVVSFSRQTGGRPILYGGGVIQGNAADLLALPELAGVMLGRSCLDAATFSSLCKDAGQRITLHRH